MRTLFAYHLISENTSERILEQFFALHFAEVLVDAVDQVGEEFESILLLANIDWLSAKAQTAPKFVRHEILQLRVLHKKINQSIKSMEKEKFKM